MGSVGEGGRGTAARGPAVKRAVAAGVVAVALSALASGCPSDSGDSGGSRASGRSSGSADGGVEVRRGDDFSLPGWVRPSPNSGLFSETAAPEFGVDTRSLDVSWRQLQPDGPGEVVTGTPGAAEDMTFQSYGRQLADRRPFWMRIFASGTKWAPDWVAEQCGVERIGPDYDGQYHLPLWNECVWGRLLELYRKVFVEHGLRADPRLRFIYVPGAFTWAEYDYDMINDAAEKGLTFEKYQAWYRHAWRDLVGLFGPYSYKLVFTGEDYPWGPWGSRTDLLTKQAVDAGMGIRTGITEVFNFHLSEAPSYGSRILPDGHMTVDESLPVHDGKHVAATENECYNDCDFKTSEPYYAVRQSSLKALQLRMNWVYAVPGPSYMKQYPELWKWVRLSVGKTASDSPDAWAALRDAEDTYWKKKRGPFTGAREWRTRPWVRNLERWLVQRDTGPDGRARRSSADVHTGVLGKENGTAYEGLSTDRAHGQTSLYFDVDDRFARGLRGPAQIKVTYRDAGKGAWWIAYQGGRSPEVRRTGDGQWKTATVTLPRPVFANGLSGRTDFRIATGEGSDLDVRFVRVVRERPA
ncbi:hypothetical protein [Actinomadura decatromicini]|uniref:Uncharacterized protein n=1 Tax=Actinomadura decatromicini TaxID=2604572 RepID=A0A5D3F5X5_9ACTN|nr:hypothetical protein [Actinomadura decatromicini]TYK44407.1 hypothetical protein FXF68_33570 [Actinomadura decatromicini]